MCFRAPSVGDALKRENLKKPSEEVLMIFLSKKHRIICQRVRSSQKSKSVRNLAPFNQVAMPWKILKKYKTFLCYKICLRIESDHCIKKLKLCGETVLSKAFKGHDIILNYLTKLASRGKLWNVTFYNWIFVKVDNLDSLVKTWWNLFQKTIFFSWNWHDF